MLARLGLLIVILMLALPAAAQEILLEKPPEYEDGEQFVGIMRALTGEIFFIDQSAEVDDHNRRYVYWVIVDMAGKEWLDGTFNPRNWQFNELLGNQNTQVVENACVGELYPITVGKVYECSNKVINTDIEHRTKARVEFKEVEHDKEGNIFGFCTLLTFSTSIEALTSRLCYTPDGKWLRSLDILSNKEERKA